jgi:hypothetical protein
MDFKFNKPLHIFALLLLLGCFFLIFIFPIITFFILTDSPQLIENLEISEIVALESQLLVIAIFILI